ncbi:MAG: aminoglycoside phosphotransferase family protein [Thermoplasmata archaeon]|nr:aminoglycoside phosphotransferase family protein [Thermoplasmata archaeon]
MTRAVRAAFPELGLRQFRVHDAGWANLVLEADGAWMFRFPRQSAVARGLGFEVRALELLGRHLTIPIPRPRSVATLGHPRGWPFLLYAKVPGRPLSKSGPLDAAARRRLEKFVGSLLRELATVPARSLVSLGAEPCSPEAWGERYRRTHWRFLRHGASLVPSYLARSVSRSFDAFYELLGRSRFRAVATHRDLGPDHILWDPRTARPTGVIDWEDLCLGDPAFDLTGLGGMGESGMAQWIRARRARNDGTFLDRLAFYRRVWPIYGVIHAAESGDLRWLRGYLPKLRRSFPT